MASKKIKKQKINYNIETNDNELISFIKILIVLVVVIGGIYGLIVLLKAKGILLEGYTKPEVKTAEISYEYTLAGTAFSKSDSEYYVVFDEFSGEKDEYLYGILYTYSQEEKKLPIYKVDMYDGMNASIKSEKSNKNANSSKDLKINGSTLIKIKNGKNILYIEGAENIEKELLKK